MAGLGHDLVAFVEGRSAGRGGNRVGIRRADKGVCPCVRGALDKRGAWVSVGILGIFEPEKREASRQFRRPIWAATSAMRTEKPHSLSYHASTRTVLPQPAVGPPMTLVWSGAKIELCGV